MSQQKFQLGNLARESNILEDALPMDLLSKVCHTVRIATAVVGIRRALKENRLSEAQKMH
jgi:hypothetical protein